MSIAEGITAHLPYLRRFGRSVTGSQKSGDAYVVSTLEAILVDRSILAPDLPPRVALYRAFLEILNSVPLNNDKSEGREPAALDAAKRNLQTLAPKARQAFLLVAVEEFQPRDAARVMDVDEQDLRSLIDDAGARSRNGLPLMW